MYIYKTLPKIDITGALKLETETNFISLAPLSFVKLASDWYYELLSKDPISTSLVKLTP